MHLPYSQCWPCLLKATCFVVDDGTKTEDEGGAETGITSSGSTPPELSSAIKEDEAANEVDG
jgi:hypothetical protein